LTIKMITFDDIENVASSMFRAPTERKAARRLENGLFGGLHCACIAREMAGRWHDEGGQRRTAFSPQRHTNSRPLRGRTPPTVGALGENGIFSS
jgi:hypothetical protein